MSGTEQARKIRAKVDKQRELYEKLECSLALEEAIPGVFNGGPVRLQWKSLPPGRGVSCWRATVLSQDGDIIGEYGAEDLPFEVWPDILKRDSRRKTRENYHPR